MAARQKYVDADGVPVPSVTTILNRFKDSGGLLYWANEQGRLGKTLQEAREPAATAGTMAHDLFEAHIHGRPPPELKGDPEVIAKAQAAFQAYLQWRNMVELDIQYTEVPLVSGKHRFGGRLDGIGVVKRMSNGLCLVDWKTSNSIYADYVWQMAAYKLLWEENYADQPITGGFHLLRFAKEEGDFAHHHFPSLADEEETFLAMRRLYDMVKKTEKRVR